jgi:hypothetical protein
VDFVSYGWEKYLPICEKRWKGNLRVSHCAWINTHAIYLNEYLLLLAIFSPVFSGAVVLLLWFIFVFPSSQVVPGCLFSLSDVLWSALL